MTMGRLLFILFVSFIVWLIILALSKFNGKKMTEEEKRKTFEADIEKLQNKKKQMK